MPTSAMKRSNSAGASGPRASMINRQSIIPPRAPNTVQRMSVGPNFADSNALSSRRESRAAFAPASSARKSYAPTPQSAIPAANRRSSMFSRPSMAPGVATGSSFFTTSGGSAMSAAVGAKVQDPRPLKDRNYQARVAQELMDYMISNNFEIEQKHALGPKAMTSPTQKDFMAMFQWLYRRLDPDYSFNPPPLAGAKGHDNALPPKFDQQVLQILRNLKYPYEKSIPKAQLGAAGGPHWPYFLGMLHWMMDLAQSLDLYDSGEFEDAAMEAGFDTSTSQIEYRYVVEHYKAWQDGEDDPKEPFDAMRTAFEDRSRTTKEQVVALESEHEQLKSAISEIEESPLAKAKEKLSILQKDCEKFTAYNASVSERLPRAQEINNNLKTDLDKIAEDIEKLEEEKKSLQEAVDKQGLTPADIDRMNTEKEKLVKSLEVTAAKLEEAQAIAVDKEADALKKLELLEHAVKRYGELGYKIGVTSGAMQDGKTYELEIIPLTRALQNAADGSSGDDERLQYDVGVGYNPQQVLNMDIRHDLKPALNKFRSDIAARIHKAQDASIEHQDYLEQIKEALHDKADEVETLEAKLSAANDEYNEIKEVCILSTSLLMTFHFAIFIFKKRNSVKSIY